jgi:hypothetical protein
VLDGFSARLCVERADEAVVYQADARENHPFIPGGLQAVEALGPFAGPLQLDAVEARGGGELPLLEDVVSQKELLLAR